MKKLLLILLTLAICQGVFSQKVYFVYLQTDPAQPFYARVQDKVYSSAASGYLVLSKLIDSVYNIAVGFPGDKWPEQHFTITVNTKDHGYLLKDFGDKGWGLFDLQTTNLIMGTKEPAKQAGSAKADAGEVSDFTNILSKAADDPSLKEKVKTAEPEVKKPVETVNTEVAKTEPVIEKKKEPEVIVEKKTADENPPAIVKTEPVVDKKKEPEIKKEPEVIQPAVVNSPPVSVKADTVAIETAAQPPKTENKEPVSKVPDDAGMVITSLDNKQPQEAKPVADEYKRSVVTRRSESSTTEGFGLVFIDMNEGIYTDTIRLLIPNPKQVVIPAVVKEEPKEEKKFLDITPAEKNGTDEKPVSENPVVENSKPVITKATNNCTAVADDNDFLKVRKRMAAGATDDNMIAEAKKYFKTKCFSTLQVKNLSLLFLDDEGKYRFYDMSYPYVTDLNNFPSLESELKDTYYINRFRAILR